MEDNFSPRQSLELIQSMIVQAKSNLSENRIYFLLWGWVSFLAILGQFFLKVVLHYRHHYIVWVLVIPAIIATLIISARQSRRVRVKTYVGASMGHLWIGIAVCFFLLSLIISLSVGWYNAYPFFILFYGLGTFVSGRFLNFPPLVIGGIFNWFLTIVCVLVPYDYQLLVAAAAILTSYIIPGHLLSRVKS